MHNFATFFLWALAACFLFQGSLAEDLRPFYMCLNDPNPNHCNSFCLTELKPMLNQLVQAQDPRTPRTLEVKIERQLQGLTKVEDSQAKLEGSLLAVQTKLEAQLQEVLKQLQAVSEKLDDAKVENQLQAILDKMETPQQAAKVADPASATNTLPSSFELIGSRYFQIVEEDADWETAERKCREMGGYLASFRNKQELNAVFEKVKEYKNHWLGINDRDNEGHFVSVASHKPAPYFEWHYGQPKDGNHELNCVAFSHGQMWDDNCKTEFYFICQADNET